MFRSARARTVLLIVSAAMTLSGGAGAQEETGAAPDLLLILDASGSMWGQIPGPIQ